MKNKLQKLKDFIEQDDNLNTNIGYGLVDQAIAEVVADVTTFKTVANVTFSPVAGAVLIGSTVALATATANAVIYYTTDGSTPDNTDNLYTTPIVVNGAQTIKVIAYKDYQNASTTQSAAYTISQVATPTADPVAGEVADDSTVALASATSGATIFYTVNGDTPTNASTPYTEPITITDAVTIKAIAYKTHYTPSAVLTAAYTIAA